ncbi:hypothetical protein Acsp03_11570 [Actinomadura sp. NBRC 104412]|uniref:hypothetical protein n=1 Tax=Actinomadura sp. NBRC 104412 TaxID=3032203 RepID=UPI0024A2185B|nr:hypothetical protein [Actinomadura sp. NBRC 104412]GLZ03690.1 hypothetical protein Acsp03_11570 [Actinomadura sp. NBRC 104412]
MDWDQPRRRGPQEQRGQAARRPRPQPGRAAPPARRRGGPPEPGGWDQLMPRGRVPRPRPPEGRGGQAGRGAPPPRGPVPRPRLPQEPRERSAGQDKGQAKGQAKKQGKRWGRGASPEPPPDRAAAGRPRPKGAGKKRGRRPDEGRPPLRENATGPRPRPAVKRENPPRKGGGGTSRRYFAAAGGLAVIMVAALVAVLVLGGGDEGTGRSGAPGPVVGRPAESGVSPSSYSSSPSTGAYAAIEQRSEDAAPLTVEEAFPERAQKIELPDAGVELSLKAKRLDGDCAAAVWGAGVGDVLRQGACSQAVRGVYADTGEKAGEGYALTVAVFNLAGKQDADRLVAMLGGGGGFVRPLEAEPPVDRFGQGFTMARGLAMGHYAVVAWAQRLDGQGTAQDETLLSLLIEGGKAPSALGRAARATRPAS